MDWDDLATDRDLLSITINEVDPLDIGEAEKHMSVWLHRGTQAFPFAEARAHLHDSCSQSHTLDLLIVRSFAVSLY